MFFKLETKASPAILLTPSAYRTGTQQAVDNFKLLRLIAALFVLVGHLGWVFYGVIPQNAAFVSFCMNNARLAVIAFFSMSGFLIAHSLYQSQSLTRFIVGRTLRIVPALFIVSIIIAFILAPLVSDLPLADYFASWKPMAYIPISSLGLPDMRLPGLFEQVPAHAEVNVSIWTLRYSYLAYTAFALLFISGFMRRNLALFWIAGALGFYAIATFHTDLRLNHPALNHLLTMGLSFVAGTIFYIFRANISFHGAIALMACLLAYALRSNPFHELFLISAISYSVLWMGLRQTSYLSSFNRFGDYSYGLFITHWPIGQSFIALGIVANYQMLVLLTLPVAAVCAFALWHLVEKRSLAALPSLCAWIDRKLRPLKTELRTAWRYLVTNPVLDLNEEHAKSMGLGTPKKTNKTDFDLLHEFQNHHASARMSQNKKA